MLAELPITIADPDAPLSTERLEILNQMATDLPTAVLAKGQDSAQDASSWAASQIGALRKSQEAEMRATLRLLIRSATRAQDQLWETIRDIEMYLIDKVPDSKGAKYDDTDGDIMKLTSELPTYELETEVEIRISALIDEWLETVE